MEALIISGLKGVCTRFITFSTRFITFSTRFITFSTCFITFATYVKRGAIFHLYGRSRKGYIFWLIFFNSFRASQICNLLSFKDSFYRNHTFYHFNITFYHYCNTWQKEYVIMIFCIIRTILLFFAWHLATFSFILPRI